MGHETWHRGEGEQQALAQKQHPSRYSDMDALKKGGAGSKNIYFLRFFGGTHFCGGHETENYFFRFFLW